eukprot:scaffold4011_cov197-Ochromonas_danica.AAC.25
MTLIGLVAMGKLPSSHLSKGNPDLLIHGVDYEGHLCGVDEPVKDLPKRVFPNLYGNNAASNGSVVPILLAVCVASCPHDGDTILDPYGNYGTWNSPKDSANFLNNCLYTSESGGSTSAITILSDFAVTAGLIGIVGFVLALILSLCFLFIVRIPLLLRSVVWLCAALIQVILSGGAFYFLSEASKRNGGYSSLCHCSTEVILLKVLGSLLLVGAVLWLSILAFWRQKIALAISLVREACIALTSMPLLCLMPMLQTVCFGGFTAIWMLFAVYLVSSGDITTHVDGLTGFSYKTMEYDLNAQRAIIFMLFAWLWSIGFIEAVGQIACAHAVLVWYFADVRSDITSGQVFSSIGTTLRYHIGTAAMGSLLISLLRGIRLSLEAIRRLDKPHANRISKCIVSCSRCFVGCCERWVKFLTKHAYVQVAVFGMAFWPSASTAFGLLLANLSRLAAVSVVGDFVVLVGKLSISLLCATIGYVYMQRYMREEVNGLVLPTVFVFFIAFTTSTMFLAVLSATSDALLQACIIDEKRPLLPQETDEEEHKAVTKPAPSRKESFRGLYELIRQEKEKFGTDEEDDSDDMVSWPVNTVDDDMEVIRQPRAVPPVAEVKTIPPRPPRPTRSAPQLFARPSNPSTSDDSVGNNQQATISMGNSQSRYAHGRDRDTTRLLERRSLLPVGGVGAGIIVKQGTSPLLRT